MTNERFIPLAIPNVGDEEAENLRQCIATNWVSTVGPFVEQFEAQIAEVSGTATASAVAAGTMGLHVALIALGVLPGDLVIVPSYTFIASVNAISHAGATPWFMDVSAEDWAMDPEKLGAILAEDCERAANGDLLRKACGRRVAALLPVYVLGTPADMDRIMPLARNYGLPVLADAAAAIGGAYKGQKLGALADLTVYSFNGNKTITTGGGGGVVGPDAARVGHVRHLVSTARVGTNYDHDAVGFNYRITNLEAAVGVAQMAKLPGFIAAKTAIRRRYDAAFAGRADVAPFPDPGYATSTYWFPGLILSKACGWDVPSLCDALRESGIQGRPFWKANHLQRPYLDAPRADVSVSEEIWPRILTLPCSTSLSGEDQDFVIETLTRLLDARAG
ncbi:MAG: aminotransferase class I/II-fold pyridoxal phosphate-dependent enzyme [Neomegalonema sp.]|nr:aminotransferase class I/II-fold pyridoxal phosphate-dependent enzyme [Neomegalonema sp.]